jgi:hypothetical protein
MGAIYFALEELFKLERAGHWPTLGFFDMKEHFAAIGFALLPAYWVCWQGPAGMDAPAQSRTMLTTILTFIVWWGFLTGHVVNDIRGFGA